MANDAVADIPFSQEIRTLFRTSLAVFLVTVIIGILNGLDIASFDRRTLLTHVHAGTLGWITLAVFGVVLWMLSEGRSTGEGSSTVRQLSLAAAVFITLHVLALFLFYPGASAALAVFGALALLAIVAFWVWVLGHSGGVWLSIPRLAVLAAITTLTIGAVFGVLIELHLAGVTMPAGVFGAHPSGMVVGYLILMGMGIAEWRLRPAGPRTSPDWLGIVQVALPFIGGLTLMAGILLNVFALIMLNVPFEVLGVLIFIGRLGPRVVRVGWLERTSSRLIGLSAVAIVINVALLTYIIVTYASNIEATPRSLFFTLDHVMFIGVMTNALFGVMYEAAGERRSFWPWSDHVLFWGMNVGLAGFAVGLILEVTALKVVFTPIMGGSILVAMAAAMVRLQAAPEPRPAQAPAA